MSDDLRDAFGDDIFMEPEEEEREIEGEETQNKTFLFAVAGLGALLFLAIAAFAIWAFIFNPIQQAKLTARNEQTLADNEAILIAQHSTATAEARPTQEEAATAESPPTATPTPVIQATHTPTPLATVTGDEGEEATPTPTPRPRRTATPTPTSGDSSATNGPDKPPDTGLGDLLPIIGAVLLLGLIIFARRLRKA